MHSTLTRRLQADVRSLSACDPDLLFSEEIRAILKQAVRKMPKMTRSVFLLSRIRNMTYSEIAAELGISVSHVNFEIRRALNLMRFELKDYLAPQGCQESVPIFFSKKLAFFTTYPLRVFVITI